MNNRLRRQIENEFPYPIALEFRRLNTKEYLENDSNRLKQILKTSETTIHLLALVALVNLHESHSKNAIEIGESFIGEFKGRLTRTSFGKWIALLRDCVKVFLNNNLSMFIEELPEYFISGKKSESEAQKAFNRLTSIRNKIAHLDFTPTKTDIENFCTEAEELLETVLSELSFIVNYPLLYVDQVSVKYPKWQQPSYHTTFSEIVGNSSEFSAYSKILKNVVHTPAVILIKEKEDDYLNLDPLIIYSDEGERKISDIFLYLDWERNDTIKYKPVWNGGAFTLGGTKYEHEILSSLQKLFGAFEVENTAI